MNIPVIRFVVILILIVLLLSACHTDLYQPPSEMIINEEMPVENIEPVQIEPQGYIRSVHDPVIAKENGRFYIFYTGARIPFICSDDFETWEYCGIVFKQKPEWTREINPALVSYWAPDISYFRDQWHLYYSISSFGSQNSAIGLATNQTLDPDLPEYEWIDHGEILRSKPGDAWNAIDPNLVIDQNEQTWLAWGSFWSGLWMHKIDPSTGKFSIEDDTNYHLADRSPGPDNTTAIEAPFIVQHAGKWYLFVSFDFCCRGVDSTYNVRVGRSDSVTGPYLDKQGISLEDGGGTLILSEYGQWRGPGHNGIMQEENIYWMVYHAYDSQETGIPKLRIESIGWDDEGWPYLPSQIHKKQEK